MKLTIMDIQDRCEASKGFRPQRTTILNVISKHFPHIQRPGRGHGLLMVTEKQALAIIGRLKYVIKK